MGITQMRGEDRGGLERVFIRFLPEFSFGKNIGGL